MALTLDGATGVVAKLATFYKTLSLVDAITNISESDRAHAVEAVRAAASRYLVLLVQADEPSVRTVEEALSVIIVQAMEQSETFDAASSTSISAGVSLLGSGATYHASNLGRYGLEQDGARDIKYIGQCTVAPYPGQNHTAKWLLAADEFNGPHSATWYKGAPFEVTVPILSSQVDGWSHLPNQTLLVNGGFERFTSNSPDNWTVSVGTPGTHLDDTTDKYIGTNALTFTGQASSNLTKIYQTLGDAAAGSPAQLLPHTLYHISCFAKATASSTGIARLSIEDDAGNEKYTSGLEIDTSGLSTSYAVQAGTFYTGDTVGSSNRFVVELTTTMNNTKVLSLDEVKLAPMVSLPGLGHIVIYEKNAACAVDDRFTLTRTTARDQAMVMVLDRLFDMSLYNLCPPVTTGGGETVADTYNVAVPT